MVSRKSFTWPISLALVLDTHENNNFPWHMWIMPIILFTSKVEIGKIVLKGSIGKEVTPIFKIIKPKCTAINRVLGLEAQSCEFTPKSHIQNKPKTKIGNLPYIFFRLMYFPISRKNWSNTTRFYIQYCAEPMKKNSLHW
jgi:hypothetical protein